MIRKTLAVLMIGVGFSISLHAEDHIVEVITDVEKGATFFKPSFSFTFDQTGTYKYHCIPHIMMGMRGRCQVISSRNIWTIKAILILVVQ